MYIYIYRCMYICKVYLYALYCHLERKPKE